MVLRIRDAEDTYLSRMDICIGLEEVWIKYTCVGKRLSRFTYLTNKLSKAVARSKWLGRLDD